MFNITYGVFSFYILKYWFLVLVSVKGQKRNKNEFVGIVVTMIFV